MVRRRERLRLSAQAPARSLLLVPLLGLLWGFNWPAVRIALTEITPWTLRAGGMTFAGLALVAVALARACRSPFRGRSGRG